MHIRNSLIALFIHRSYTMQNSAMGKATGRISSGIRINSAADDAAGLAISEKIRARIRGITAAMRCSEDGASLVQTAEGAMASAQAVLQRMRELAVQSASDTNNDTDRDALDKEYQQLLRELDDIAQDTRFNGRALLSDGSGGVPGALSIQTGADAGDTFALVLNTMTTDALGVSGTHVRNVTDAAEALGSINSAIDEVSADRADLGAAQARLSSRISSLEIAAEELTAADSRIRDTDIAEEMVRLTQARLLSHMSAAMMVQANALAGNVLFLMVSQMTVSANDAPQDTNSAGASVSLQEGATGTGGVSAGSYSAEPLAAADISYEAEE
jgi:flagellin